MLSKGLLVLTKIQAYLQSANTGAPGMSDEIIEEAGERFKMILRKTFNQTRGDNFRFSLSSYGRPECISMMERDKAPKEKQTYAFRMKMLVGDVTELLLRAIIKASGVAIEKSNQKVTLELGPLKLNGEYDDRIDGAIYDTKSSAGWTFKNKWMRGFDEIEKSDSFGYCSQLFGYAEADKAKAGGWFVVNKESGEIVLVEARDTPELRAKWIKKGEENVYNVINPDHKFRRMFSDLPEYFKKQPTGNRKLDKPCEFCDYKFSCWPGLKVIPAVKSEAENPPMVYYTVLNPETQRSEDDSDALQVKRRAKKEKKNEANSNPR